MRIPEKGAAYIPTSSADDKRILLKKKHGEKTPKTPRRNATVILLRYHESSGMRKTRIKRKTMAADKKGSATLPPLEDSFFQEKYIPFLGAVIRRVGQTFKNEIEKINTKLKLDMEPPLALTTAWVKHDMKKSLKTGALQKKVTAAVIDESIEEAFATCLEEHKDVKERILSERKLFLQETQNLIQRKIDLLLGSNASHVKEKLTQALMAAAEESAESPLPTYDICMHFIRHVEEEKNLGDWPKHILVTLFHALTQEENIHTLQRLIVEEEDYFAQPQRSRIVKFFLRYSAVETLKIWIEKGGDIDLPTSNQCVVSLLHYALVLREHKHIEFGPLKEIVHALKNAGANSSLRSPQGAILCNALAILEEQEAEALIQILWGTSLEQKCARRPIQGTRIFLNIKNADEKEFPKKIETMWKLLNQTIEIEDKTKQKKLNDYFQKSLIEQLAADESKALLHYYIQKEKEGAFAKWSEGRTLLCVAANVCNAETVTTLLEAGMDIAMRDVVGRTPADYAKRREDEEGLKITLLLQERQQQLPSAETKSAKKRRKQKKREERKNANSAEAISASSPPISTTAPVIAYRSSSSENNGAAIAVYAAAPAAQPSISQSPADDKKNTSAPVARVEEKLTLEAALEKTSTCWSDAKKAGKAGKAEKKKRIEKAREAEKKFLTQFQESPAEEKAKIKPRAYALIEQEMRLVKNLEWYQDFKILADTLLSFYVGDDEQSTDKKYLQEQKEILQKIHDAIPPLGEVNRDLHVPGNNNTLVTQTLIATYIKKIDQRIAVLEQAEQLRQEATQAAHAAIAVMVSNLFPKQEDKKKSPLVAALSPASDAAPVEFEKITPPPASPLSPSQDAPPKTFDPAEHDIVFPSPPSPSPEEEEDGFRIVLCFNRNGTESSYVSSEKIKSREQYFAPPKASEEIVEYKTAESKASLLPNNVSAEAAGSSVDLWEREPTEEYAEEYAEDLPPEEGAALQVPLAALPPAAAPHAPMYCYAPNHAGYPPPGSPYPPFPGPPPAHPVACHPGNMPPAFAYPSHAYPPQQFYGRVPQRCDPRQPPTGATHFPM